MSPAVHDLVEDFLGFRIEGDRISPADVRLAFPGYGVETAEERCCVLALLFPGSVPQEAAASDFPGLREALDLAKEAQKCCS